METSKINIKSGELRQKQQRSKRKGDWFKSKSDTIWRKRADEWWTTSEQKQINKLIITVGFAFGWKNELHSWQLERQRRWFLWAPKGDWRLLQVNLRIKDSNKRFDHNGCR